ncbi:MAG: TRAP transporter substrate-binding protein DctP [Deltaproteobacteria bacterium]|nr:TRAP transporter substrate-binding protein DctP [Deltaproteobacteria bacterium]
MKKRIFSRCGISIFFVALFALILTPLGSAAETKTIELKYAYPHPNVSLVGRSCEYFADLLEQRSNGKLKIARFPAGMLVQAERVREAVETGIIDIGHMSPHYVATRFPSNDACMLPMKIKSAWASSHAVNDWFHHFKPKEFDGVQTFFATNCPPFALQFRDKPIYKPGDLKGVKLRAAGSQASAFAKALGAVPVHLPMPETFEALSRKTVDGLLAPAETLKGWKHAEIAKYVTLLPISYAAPNHTFMNQDKWNSLPPDLKDVFNDVVPDALEATACAWEYGDVLGIEYFNSLGGERKFIEIPPNESSAWEELVVPIRKDFIEAHKDLPVAEYLKYLEERNEYWNERRPDNAALKTFVEKELMKQ